MQALWKPWSGVSLFKIGDRVIGSFFENWIGGNPTKEKLADALGGSVDGTLVEYRIFLQEALVLSPPHLSFEEASSGLVVPVLTYLAVQMNFGFAMPIMISTILFLVLVVISVLLGPETKGKTLTADLEVIKGVAQPAT